VAAKLHIVGPYEDRIVEVVGELTIGRTNASDLVIDDSGLSRRNTTFFIDDAELLVADEDSTNGTYVNGERIGRPVVLNDGDVIKIGSTTSITVGTRSATRTSPRSEHSTSESLVSDPITPTRIHAPLTTGPAIETRDNTKILLIAAGGLTLVIVLLTGIGLALLSREPEPKNGVSRTPQIQTGALIPVRVIDPLGSEDEEDINDLISSWEVAEDEIVADSVESITGASMESEEAELNVSAALLADRQRKAFEPRPGETGIRPTGLAVPKELYGDGVIKQKAKLREMNSSGYRQPLDFAELAEKRLSGDLIEMPMASQSFYLDVGGSAQDRPFSAFSFSQGVTDILPGTPKWAVLSKLADNFAGQRYDLNNPLHRKQMRMRLLRMFQRPAKPILKELADAYHARFGRPLRVTSLTRSMDYQILLNANNANSFKVRGEGSLPPHTSGCAFDLARKHMPAEEQNFVMQKLAEMERAGKLDALIEYGTNACFHVFIYPDGREPRM
jgi:hypothetical protein